MSEIIDEILEHGQASHGQVLELNPTAPDAELFPRNLWNLVIVNDAALNLFHVNKTVVAAEDLYAGAFPAHGFCRKVAHAQSIKAYVLYPTQVDEFLGLDKSSEGPLFSLVPLIFSLVFTHGLFHLRELRLCSLSSMKIAELGRYAADGAEKMQPATVGKIRRIGPQNNKITAYYIYFSCRPKGGFCRV